MQTKQLIGKVTQLCQPILQEMGLSLWDVTFEKEGPKHVLTVYIDRDEGVFIEDCERVSRALDPLLDAREFDSLPAYTLCVSSAGLERQLSRPEHFAWAQGKKIELRFYKAKDGASELVGVLRGRDESGVSLTTGQGDVTIPLAEVASARLYFSMNDNR